MKIEIGTEFTHRDFFVGKRRQVPIRLVVHKIDGDKVVAHEAGTEMDRDGYWTKLYCLPRGLDTPDVTLIEEEAPAFVPQIVEADEGMKEEWI